MELNKSRIISSSTMVEQSLGQSWRSKAAAPKAVAWRLSKDNIQENNNIQVKFLYPEISNTYKSFVYPIDQTEKNIILYMYNTCKKGQISK